MFCFWINKYRIEKAKDMLNFLWNTIWSVRKQLEWKRAYVYQRRFFYRGTNNLYVPSPHGLQSVKRLQSLGFLSFDHKMYQGRSTASMVHLIPVLYLNKITQLTRSNDKICVLTRNVHLTYDLMRVVYKSYHLWLHRGLSVKSVPGGYRLMAFSNVPATVRLFIEMMMT